MRADISAIADRFPDLQIAFVTATGLTIPEHRPAVLDDHIKAVEADAAARFRDVAMPDIPGVAVWRQAYKDFGIKKTSYRCSVERLVRKVARDGALAGINPFVDAYNAVSLAHVFPLGADDLDRIAGDLSFRPSRENDTFYALGQEPETNDPPKLGEIVYADDEKVLCRRWNWYQDARSPVTPQTTRAVVTIQSLGPGDLEAAIADLSALLREHCGAMCGIIVLSRERPQAELPIASTS
ncbi:MAG: phenylalanine--tRNA ligase beta subunit-related protein [Pseudomonadota bacterium]